MLWNHGPSSTIRACSSACVIACYGNFSCTSLCPDPPMSRVMASFSNAPSCSSKQHRRAISMQRPYIHIRSARPAHPTRTTAPLQIRIHQRPQILIPSIRFAPQTMQLVKDAYPASGSRPRSSREDVPSRFTSIRSTSPSALGNHGVKQLRPLHRKQIKKKACLSGSMRISIRRRPDRIRQIQSKRPRPLQSVALPGTAHHTALRAMAAPHTQSPHPTRATQNIQEYPSYLKRSRSTSFSAPTSNHPLHKIFTHRTRPFTTRLHPAPNRQ